MNERHAVIYVHGRGGSPEGATHYAPLFPESDVIGIDYRAVTPWEAGPELRALISERARHYDRCTLIAESIGAYFGICARLDELVDEALFISPVTDMERLIRGMMLHAGVTDRQLEAEGEIPTSFGETLSWRYLSYVRAHPVCWTVPTRILYGSADSLIERESVEAFAEAHGAELSVMEGGEHWFHTEEQLAFLDRWIQSKE